MRSAPEELAAVCEVLGVFALSFGFGEACFEVEEFGAEIRDSFSALLCFLRDEFVVD